MADTQITTCTEKTISRWHTSDPQDIDQTDPGLYQDGETVECRCGATVAVTHRITNERTAGTQYVGNLAAH